ncbi:MAG: MMPL family transporter [Acidobacteria bacterium]|nr:MMPL family transporter [Acidobacteriota bacterium]
MGLPEFSINRPVTVSVGCLLAILLGAIAFVKIPVDLMPETVYPTISARAEYPGVGPEEMETLVARPLEEAFSAAPGVKEITSTCSEGNAYVRVGFNYGIDLDEAANELRARLDRRRGDLPEDMEPPVMYKFDVSQFPIMFLTVAADDMDPKELRHFTEKSLQPRLERVPGVAQFTIRGGLRREIHVDLELNKLRALDLDVADVVRIVRDENLNEPVGPVREGRYEVLLRTKGEFATLEQIRNVVVSVRNGVPVYLREIATVEDSHEEVRQMVSVDGQAAVRLFVYKQSGSNTVQVSDGVWSEVARIHKDYPNIHISTTGDSADFIKAAIANVRDSAWQGGLLAVGVLLVFLGSFSSAFVIGVAIPVSVIATFALMYFAGFSLNTVSFGGLALGVGMLVDNAIVVLENIVRHREEGADARTAAITGSKEVATAITASTMTTVAVFVPVLFTQGMSAVTFQQLAYVVSFSLLCSLIVALTVVPAMTSRMLEHSKVGRGNIFQRTLRGCAAWISKLGDWYGDLLDGALRRPWTVLGGAALLFLMALEIMPLIGVELQPEVDEGEIRVNLELEPGTRVEVTDDMLQHLARIVKDKVPEVQTIMIESGGGGFSSAQGQNSGELRIRLVDQRQRSRKALDVANEIRPMMQIGPGMLVRTSVSSGMYRRSSSTGSNQGDRLSVEVRGDNLEILKSLAEQVREAMVATPGVADAQTSQRAGLPEMVVEVDRDKASSMGLNVFTIAETFKTAVGGRRSSMYRQEGDEYNILIRLREPDRLAVDQIADVPLNLPSGRTTPALSVVNMTRQEGPTQIDRRDQERIVVVSANIQDRDLGAIVTDLQGAIAQISRPAGYEIRFGGEYEEQVEAFDQMTFAAILALVLVYMVMAAQFESWRDPFIVLFSAPLATVGVVLALLLTDTTFNMQAFLGVIILVGIVVNNAIVLIDYANQLRRDHGYSPREAVITAGARRLRPILMTTLTTVLGLVPMALGLGEGGELQAPLARTVIGGLTSSTLITLVVIPAVYMLLEERGWRREQQRLGVGEMTEAPAAGD